MLATNDRIEQAMTENEPGRLIARGASEIATSTFAVGRRTVVAVNDGEFAMSREFLSSPIPHDELVDDTGIVRLPIGCFLVPGEPLVLIDAGFGMRQAGALRGGLLIEELQNIGVRPDDIAIVAISHLHHDHRGWIASPDGAPMFPNAEVFIGAGDWHYFIDDKKGFVESPDREVLEHLYEIGRVDLLDGERELVPGIIAMPAPGHTPGHTVYAIVDGDDRAVLLGDAMYCPQQLTELDWGAIVDIDPTLAKQTRTLLARDLESHDAQAIGCHFPNLHATRLLSS